MLACPTHRPQRTYSTYNDESDHKDVVIAQLKAQIYEANKPFTTRNNQTQAKSKQDYHRNHPSHSPTPNALPSISKLESEIQTLERQIDRKVADIDKFKLDKDKLHSISDSLQNELYDARKQLSLNKSNARSITDSCQSLNDQLASSQAQKDKEQIKYEGFFNGVKQQQQESKDKQLLLKRLEEELVLKKTQHQNIEMRNEKLKVESDRMYETIRDANYKIQDQERSIKVGQNRKDTLTRDSKLLEGDVAVQRKSMKMEEQRNKEIEKRLIQLQDRVSDKMNRFDAVFSQKNVLNNQIQDLDYTNVQLRKEWGELRSQIKGLLGGNKELLSKLKKCCDDDDIVRALIRRNQRVEELTTRVRRVAQIIKD